MKRPLTALSVLLLLLATIAIADTVTTTVFFNVPTTVSFTVTLPGQGGVSSGSTASIEYNSSTGTTSQANASVVGGGGNVQNATVPIFNYTNTGTVSENVTLSFNATVPSGIVVKASQAVGGYKAACIAPSANSTDCVFVNNTAVVVANALGVGSSQAVWMWADFSGVSGGTNVRLLTHTSSAS